MSGYPVIKKHLEIEVLRIEGVLFMIGNLVAAYLKIDLTYSTYIHIMKYMPIYSFNMLHDEYITKYIRKEARRYSKTCTPKYNNIFHNALQKKHL